MGKYLLQGSHPKTIHSAKMHFARSMAPYDVINPACCWYSSTANQASSTEESMVLPLDDRTQFPERRNSGVDHIAGFSVVQAKFRK